MTAPQRKPDKPQGCTNFKLRQLLRRIARHYDLEMASVGMKTTQFSMLTHLLNLGPVAPSELARQMGLEASTLTRNLRLLTAQGWAVQGPGADARSRRIEITPSGRVKQLEAKHYWKKAQLALNKRMGDQQVAELHALIEHGLACFTDTADAYADPLQETIR
jgi:DNA-binding MarR family transcriptional regulator